MYQIPQGKKTDPCSAPHKLYKVAVKTPWSIYKKRSFVPPPWLTIKHSHLNPEVRQETQANDELSNIYLITRINALIIREPHSFRGWLANAPNALKNYKNYKEMEENYKVEE